jgi:2-polyprenyl-6-methoxyphenol hydroxylase-like FAD-dependent oxidoreductase
VSSDQERFGVAQAQLGSLDPAGLHALATMMIRSWHPDLRGLVARAEIDETFLVRIRASVPVPGWQPSRVTLLGDAIHAMSPARGSGANTALQDAGLLCGTLTQTAQDDRALLGAIGAYEKKMREYGYAAMQASKQAEAETGGTTQPHHVLAPPPSGPQQNPHRLTTAHLSPCARSLLASVVAGGHRSPACSGSARRCRPRSRGYAEAGYRVCRSLWAELTEYHRRLYGHPSIGGDDPGAGFDGYLATRNGRDPG